MRSGTEAAPRSLRVGIVCDLLEERWPSMDLVAEQLASSLRDRGTGIAPVLLRPRMRRRLTWLPIVAGRPRSDIIDRLANRYVDYPRWLRRLDDDLDVYHVVDHSYAHLVSVLPSGRTIVTCHDLDAFRCLLEGRGERRSAPFRAMVRRTMRGLQAASRVICVSGAVRDELVGSRIVPAERVHVVPNGVDPVFDCRPDPASDGALLRRLQGRARPRQYLLHVGSGIPRKRIDVLLDAFARAAATRPALRLIRVGALTDAQRAHASALDVAGRVLELPFLDRTELAAAYRAAAVTVVSSEREGFGLPVLESLACGTPVVASDIPALRETGGTAALYAAAGDAAGFARAVEEALGIPRDGWIASARSQASRFTWASCAGQTESVYRQVGAVAPAPARASTS